MPLLRGQQPSLVGLCHCFPSLGDMPVILGFRMHFTVWAVLIHLLFFFRLLATRIVEGLPHQREKGYFGHPGQGSARGTENGWECGHRDYPGVVVCVLAWMFRFGPATRSE